MYREYLKMLIRRLRLDRQTHDTPIIVLTPWTYEPDRRRACAAGCNGFLLKPYHRDCEVAIGQSSTHPFP